MGKLKSMIVEKILEVLQMQAENAVDLFNIVTTDRSTSYRRAKRSLLRGPAEFKYDWADLYRKRQAFHSLLNKLKREGFIVRKKAVRNSFWSVTEQGLKRLSFLKSKAEKKPGLLKKEYDVKKSQNVVIIAFDVPERERRKRHWLRASLISLGFKKVQQSVWLGKIRIPYEFIEDIKDHNMLSYIQIFSVTKRGTLVEKDL